jgi:hypothetical protein
MAEPWYRWDGADLVLRLRIQPRAARDELAGPHGNRLRVRIQAPPVDGKANARLISLVAEWCGVPKSQVTLVAGETGRDKTLRVVAPWTPPPGVRR